MTPDETVWVEFASEVGSGRILLYTPDYTGPLRARAMNVETSLESVRNVRFLSPDEPPVPRLMPPSMPGEYAIVGVVQVIVRDEAGKSYTVEVVAGSGWFSLAVDDVPHRVTEGDWLSFTAVGLTFSDSRTG